MWEEQLSYHSKISTRCRLRIPLRLLDCFLLVMPSPLEGLGAGLGDGWGARCAFVFTVVGPGLGPGAFRKREGEGMVTVSAIYGGRGVCSVLSPA